MTENRKCVRIFDWLDIFPDRLEFQVMYMHSDGILVAQAAGGLPWDINVDSSPTPEIAQKQFTLLTCTYNILGSYNSGINILKMWKFYEVH